MTTCFFLCFIHSFRHSSSSFHFTKYHEMCYSFAININYISFLNWFIHFRHNTFIYIYRSSRWSYIAFPFLSVTSRITQAWVHILSIWQCIRSVNRFPIVDCVEIINCFIVPFAWKTIFYFIFVCVFFAFATYEFIEQYS